MGQGGPGPARAAERDRAGEAARPRSRRRPTGRRPGDSGTREAILGAALGLFAERGYDGASLRAIAGRAGVDPALIRHFFGDKRSLFGAVLTEGSGVPDRMVRALAGDPAQVGRRLVETYLGAWEDPASGPVLVALMRSAVADERITALLWTIIAGRMAEALVGPEGVVEPELSRGALIAMSQLMGVAVARYVMVVPPLVAIDFEVLVDELAPMVQKGVGRLLGQD